MPRCQRTFRVLTDRTVHPVTGAARWRCGDCPDAETYETVTSPDLQHYLTLAVAACMRDFGKPTDVARPIELLWGLSPECVREPVERRYYIYLQTGSDAHQARLQIGHEVFHRVCSRGRIFHWTHEMLACLFSVRLLQQNGASEYAAQTEYEYREQAARCTVAQMLDADLSRPPYPPGLYGRAFVTGRALCQDEGWETLCQLPRWLERHPTGIYPAWLSTVLPYVGTDLREHEPVFLNQK